MNRLYFYVISTFLNILLCCSHSYADSSKTSALDTVEKQLQQLNTGQMQYHQESKLPDCSNPKLAPTPPSIKELHIISSTHINGVIAGTCLTVVSIYQDNRLIQVIDVTKSPTYQEFPFDIHLSPGMRRKMSVTDSSGRTDTAPIQDPENEDDTLGLGKVPGGSGKLSIE